MNRIPTARLHDAVVVGAGPAGSIAALRLATAGCRVLLLERGPLGRDKPCGGGLTARAWSGLEVDVADLVRARVDSAELRRGRRRVRVSLSGHPVLMVLRRDFDRRLTEAAAAAGAEVHDSEPVLEVTRHRGHVETRTARDRYRTGAALLGTGGEGALRSGAGFGTVADEVAVAVEVEGPARATGLDGGRFVFDYGVPGGYAWAFPKGEWWNAGVLTTDSRTGPRLRRLLADFVEGAGLRFDGDRADVRRATGRRIPVWSRRRPLHRGSVAVIGDAAGLADPFFGEGIATALVSGRLAADSVLAFLAGRRSDLGGYTAAVDAMLHAHLWRMRQVGRLTYRVPATTLAALDTVGPLRRLVARMAAEPFPGWAGTTQESSTAA